MATAQWFTGTSRKRIDCRGCEFQHQPLIAISGSMLIDDLLNGLAQVDLFLADIAVNGFGNVGRFLPHIEERALKEFVPKSCSKDHSPTRLNLRS